MKKYFTLLLFLIGGATIVTAQTLTTFQRGYQDTTLQTGFSQSGYGVGADMAEMTDGDFLVALNYGLMRTDNIGLSKWIKSYSVPGAITPGNIAARQVVFTQILPLPNGEAILMGRRPSGTVTTKPDTPIICRMNAAGTITWAKIMIPPSPQSLQVRGATLTANGELFLCLFSNFSPSVVGDYAIVMRMDLSGNVLWQRYLINNSTGTFNRQFRSWDAAECGNGDFLISGFGNVPDSNLVVRLTSTGIVRWVKSYNCSSPNSRRAFQRVREVSGGNIAVVMGDIATWYGNGYLVLDSTGNINGVQKAYKDSGYYSDAIIRPNGDALFTTSNVMYKVDINGSVVFAHHYTPPTQKVYLTALCATADGGYAVGGGYTSIITGSGFRTAGYVAKTDASGASAPYTDNISIPDSNCNCRMTVTNITDTAVNFPLTDMTLSGASFYLQDTLFSLTLDVPVAIAPSETISIYPNPVKDAVHFSGVNAVNAALYSADGKLVQAERNVHSMNVATLPAGMYFILLKDEHGKQLGLQRLMKE